MTTHEEPPGDEGRTKPRHLHPVEPPFDPDYDRPETRTPHNFAAEQAVLGALILAPHIAPQLALELDGPDFYRPHHETIWDAAHHLIDTGTPLDPITLAAHLGKTGELTKVGGALYLHELTTACTTTANAPYYAGVVRDNARLRAVQQTGTRLLQIAAKADPTAIDTGLAEALQTLDDTVTRFGPRDEGPNTSGLYDLSWILTTGTPPAQPPPVFAQRTDGHALFYAGKVNGVFGDPESGKTWLAQIAIAEALATGGTAAMVDVDHNGPDHTAGRLALLGTRLEHLADPEKFRYYGPEDGDQLRAAMADITSRAPTVVVIDSLGEVFPLLGLNTNDGDEITKGLRLIAKPATAGSCVINIDHLPKGADARSTGYAIGSIAKKRAIRGSYLRADVRLPFAPGSIGKATLRIEKDTSGELRKASGGGYAGTLTLDSTQAHVSTWEISRDDSPMTADGHFRPTHLMEAVSRYIEDNDQCSGRDIREAINSAPKNVLAALKCLIDEGFVSTHPGKARTVHHHSIALYREAEDDNA